MLFQAWFAKTGAERPFRTGKQPADAKFQVFTEATLGRRVCARKRREIAGTAGTEGIWWEWKLLRCGSDFVPSVTRKIANIHKLEYE
ncbi:hypothetical protein F511_03750 [Dorcoceras hygrometricum]|uniref:Uncharacterized protein n=1 Tax=Dorcoceras hygrometricum TaxID=472368 RepID=A0A2Z7B6Q3_9LAMI|nr:hypothetical protein F511_03750 [Dorcoceras hygrometricum]